MNAPMNPLGAADLSRLGRSSTRSSILVLASLLPLLSHAALPASRAYSTVETKVSINAGDFAGDNDTGYNPLPGASSVSSSASRSYSYTSGPLTGYSGSGSGNASASATAAYGSLKGIVSGFGTATGASAATEARLTATFEDYLSFSASGGGPISILFGLGIEGVVNAVNGNAGGGISGGISIWTPPTAKLLWSGGASINSATDPTETVSKLVTFQAGDILQIAAGLGMGGGFSISSAHTGNPPVAIAKSGSFTANFSNTAELYFEILTPGASYTSASGTVYRSAPSWATPVPEPATYLLTLAGLAGVMLTATARRRTGRR